MKNSLLFKIVICSFGCLLLGSLSGLLSVQGIEGWYKLSNKPSWNPPNWIFGPVWTFLYLTMGLALALIWHQKVLPKKKAVVFFSIQLVLNLLWSFLFLEWLELIWLWWI